MGGFVNGVADWQAADGIVLNVDTEADERTCEAGKMSGWRIPALPPSDVYSLDLADNLRWFIADSVIADSYRQWFQKRVSTIGGAY